MGVARIGRIRLKDTNVVALSGKAFSQDERKAEVLNHVAHSYDRYVKDFGRRPDAIVGVLGGIRQSSRSFWVVNGDSRGGAKSMLSLAHATLIKDLASDG